MTGRFLPLDPSSDPSRIAEFDLYARPLSSAVLTYSRRGASCGWAGRWMQMSDSRGHVRPATDEVTDVALV